MLMGQAGQPGREQEEVMLKLRIVLAVGLLPQGELVLWAWRCFADHLLWNSPLCVCLCRLPLIPFLSWSPVSEVSGVWDLWREEGYKRARQETPVPGFRASCIPEVPRGPSPWTLQLQRPIVLLPGL